MTQEDKDLLVKDLCERLSHGVKCSHFDDNNAHTLLGIDDDVLHLDCPVYDEGDGYVEIEYCKPHLRPLSSMTKEEKEELEQKNIRIEVFNAKIVKAYKYYHNIWEQPPLELEDWLVLIDWLNAHHFDYRGLIERGLALEAPEGTYN